MIYFTDLFFFLDDFAHLVFKAPIFEDLIAVVSVYTNAFGPMTDREVAMVQKRMYQLNRQTVRAMHEIINQKQLIAGMNSADGDVSVTRPQPLSPLGQPWMNTSPYQSSKFGNFSMQQNHHDMPTTMLNTPMHTPNGPDRFMSKPMTSSAKKADFNESITIQDLLRFQQSWANDRKYFDKELWFFYCLILVSVEECW